MKKYIVIISALAVTASVLAQGTINYSTRVVGAVVAPVYGPELDNPSVSKTGNTPAGTPAGTQTYSGELLKGDAWSAELFAGVGANVDEGDLVAVPDSLTAFRTSAALAGSIAPRTPLAIPGVVEGGVATLQLRVWDNAGGTITTWAEAEAAWLAGTIAAGKSVAFNSAPLAGGITLPPDMVGLQSFNIYYIPEPSTFALLGLGALGMFLFRRK